MLCIVFVTGNLVLLLTGNKTNWYKLIGLVEMAHLHIHEARNPQ